MEALVNFEFRNTSIQIQCKTSDKLKKICSNFCLKVLEDIDSINDLDFKYNENTIDLEKTFAEIITQDDIENNKINILVEPKLIETNYLFNLSNEEGKTKFNFEESECQCRKHENENYIEYCQDCKMDLCFYCKNEHEGHNIFEFRKHINLDDRDFIKKKFFETDCVEKDDFISKIKELMEELENIKNKVELGFEIKKNFVNNYQFKNRNFKIINLITLSKRNYCFFEDVNNAIKNRDIIFNKINNLIDVINNNQYQELIANNDVKNENNNTIEKIIEQEPDKFINTLKNIFDYYSQKIQRNNEINFPNNFPINCPINNNFCNFQNFAFVPNELNNNNQISNLENDNRKEISLEYKINGEKCIKLFDDKFVEKNKEECTITYEGHNDDILKEKIDIGDLNKNEGDTLEVKLKGAEKIKNISNMFNGCDSLLTVKGLENINANKMTDMSSIFYNCKTLIFISGITNWDTSNVTKMSHMFYGCSSLQSLPDISPWNLENVSDISYMFYGCSSLEALPDISTWNTSSINNLDSVFYKCHLLKSLPDIYKWDTSKVTNMNCLFRECSSLEEIPNISNWNTSKVRTLKYLFSNCKKLNKINDDNNDLSKWVTCNFKDISYLFFGCSELKILPNLSKWALDKVTSMSYLFTGCSQLDNYALLITDFDKEIKYKLCKESIKSLKKLFD